MTNENERTKASVKRRCRATNVRGEACRATVVGSGGYCTVHDPERKVDMRALGRKGGTARRKGVAEQLPAGERESLRQYLRDGLDRETIRAAIERSLAGENESARVACVRFLSDLELYRQDDQCPVCAERAADAEASEERSREWLVKLVYDAVVTVLEGSPKTGLAHMVADLLDERQQQRIADLRKIRIDQLREGWVDDLTREALAGV